MKKILFIFLMIFISITSYGCLSDRGLIALKTIPPGATVYYNNAKVGETPVEFEHDFDNRSNLTIQKEGFLQEKEVLDQYWVRREIALGHYQEGDFIFKGKKSHIWKVSVTRTLQKAQ